MIEFIMRKYYKKMKYNNRSVHDLMLNEEKVELLKEKAKAFESISILRWLFTRSLPIDVLENNIEDIFSEDDGCNHQALIEYQKKFAAGNTHNIDKVLVLKLREHPGRYLIQDGHHKVEGAKRANKRRVSVFLLDWDF